MQYNSISHAILEICYIYIGNRSFSSLSRFLFFTLQSIYHSARIYIAIIIICRRQLSYVFLVWFLFLLYWNNKNHIISLLMMAYRHLFFFLPNENWIVQGQCCCQYLGTGNIWMVMMKSVRGAPYLSDTMALWFMAATLAIHM